MIVSHLSYRERAGYCLSKVAKKLFELIDHKKTNLILSADVTSAKELLRLANELGTQICALKTHMDIIQDFSPALITELRQLANQHHFLLFEDRKFADIGNTVKQQYEGGIYHIVDWADMVTVHSIPGPGLLQGLAEVGRKKNRGIVLLAEMSSSGHLMNADYIKNTLEMAEPFADFVVGFVTQRALSDNPHWIYMTPGVKLETGSDSLGQQYHTPEKAILENGSDIIIVGRGITEAADPLKIAQIFRNRAWEAYLNRTQ